MRLSQYIDRDPHARTTRKTKAKRASIASHKAFVPMLTLWGAALLGLIVMVLPDTMIDRMSALTGDAIAGRSAQFVFAGLAALLGGAFTFVVGGAFHSKAATQDSGRQIAAAVKARRISPIDPATELGSASLDSPLEGMPFGAPDDDEVIEDAIFDCEPAAEASDAVTQPDATKRKPTLGELAARNYELEEPAEPAKKNKKKGKDEVAFTHRQFQSALIESCEGATCEASAASDADASPLARKPEEAEPKSPPRVLDLEEFAELPGRNAVWVEEVAEEPAAAPEVTAAPVEPQAESQSEPQPKRPLIPANALEKLREKPADELSLVEMVERFAGALHEHQQSERARRPDGGMGRDAALVEALKALTLFTEQGFDKGSASSSANQLSETERELRNALSKLQTLRGAA